MLCDTTLSEQGLLQICYSSLSLKVSFSGISPLMTAQAGKFDKITELLTRALELKIPEDGYLPHTKKVIRERTTSNLLPDYKRVLICHN